MFYSLLSHMAAKSPQSQRTQSPRNISNLTLRTKRFHLHFWEELYLRKLIENNRVAVVVSFFICWSPFHLQRLMADYVSNPTPLFDTFYTIIRHVSGVTYYLSPTVNPILYQVMSLKFQQAFKDTFGPFSKCLRGEQEQNPVTNMNTECTQASTRIRRYPNGSPQTTVFNI